MAPAPFDNAAMRLLPPLLFACCALPLKAVLADGAAAQAPSHWQAVDDATLDDARGGFELPSGLAVGLGIERIVAVNGALVTQSRFAIADVRDLNANQAAMVREAMSSMLVVQNGRVTSQDNGAVPANAGPSPSALPSPLAVPPSVALPAAVSTPAAALIIQNSLDNQAIRSQLVIDASVNTLAGFKSLNFSSSVLDALANAANRR
jgi:hypothetical protein